MASSVVSVPPDATVAEALGVMDEKNIRVLPVLHEDRTCAGLISVFKMSKFFLPTPGRLIESRRVVGRASFAVRKNHKRFQAPGFRLQEKPATRSKGQPS